MRLAICLTALLASPASADYGGFLKGNDLIRFCDPNARQTAFGYAAGALEATQAASGMGTSITYCLPKDVTLSQTTDVMCKYLAENPANRHLSAGMLTLMAFTEAWPCPAP